MARSNHVRRFLFAAEERLKDAEFLMEVEPPRATGAVYLAGYAVECALKALVLSQVPPREQETFAKDRFKGAKAHDYDSLRRLYHGRRGPQEPGEIRNDLLLVNTWGWLAVMSRAKPIPPTPATSSRRLAGFWIGRRRGFDDIRVDRLRHRS